MTLLLTDALERSADRNLAVPLSAAVTEALVVRAAALAVVWLMEQATVHVSIYSLKLAIVQSLTGCCSYLISAGLEGIFGA